MGSKRAALTPMAIVMLLVLAGCAGPRDAGQRPSETPTKPTAADSSMIDAKTETWTRIDWSSMTYSRAGTLAISTANNLADTCTIDFGFAFKRRGDGSSFAIVETKGDALVGFFGGAPPFDGLPSASAMGVTSGSVVRAVVSAVGQDRVAISGTAKPGANQTILFSAAEFSPFNNPGTRGASIDLRADCPSDAPLTMGASNETLILPDEAFGNATAANGPGASAVQGGSTSATFRNSAVQVVAASTRLAASGELRITHPGGKTTVDLTRHALHRQVALGGDYRFDLDRVGASGCDSAQVESCKASRFLVLAYGSSKVTSTRDLDQIFEALGVPLPS